MASHQMGNRAHREIRFCVTCEARDRTFIDGRCVICGNPPVEPPNRTFVWTGVRGNWVEGANWEGGEVPTSDDDVQVVVKRQWFKGWTVIDWWACTLCVIATVYLVVQVVRWVV